MPSQNLNLSDDIQIFNQNKLKFSNKLGANNFSELLSNTLKNGFSGDKFRNNNQNIFNNFFRENNLENDQSQNFLEKFNEWTKNKIDQSLKVRFRVMILNVLLLFGAFGISFVNPIGGMTFGIISSIACAITEGVSKRNISNIGHLQTHFGNKIEEATKDLIKNVSQDVDFRDEAKTTLNELQKPINFKYTSATSRGLSYFSGFAISSIFNITNRITPISEIASPIIFGAIGSIIPLLPLLVYFFSSKSANQRCQTLSNRSEYFNQINDIVFLRDNWNIQDPQNTQNPQNINSKLNNLTDKFNSHIRESDCDGRLPQNKKFKKNPESDYQYNPTKAVILPQYLSAKIHRQLNDKFVGHQNKDLADFKESSISGSDVVNASLEFTREERRLSSDSYSVDADRGEEGGDSSRLQGSQSILISSILGNSIQPDNQTGLKPEPQEPQSLLQSRNFLNTENSRSPSPMPVIISSSNSQKLDGDDFTAKSNQM